MLCVGIHTVTREDCLFSFWQKIIRDNELNYRTELFHPLTECLVCMSSFWTCFYFGFISEMAMFEILPFLAIYLVIVLGSVVGGKKFQKLFVFCYLVAVFVFVSNLNLGFSPFIIMFAVTGANRIASYFMQT